MTSTAIAVALAGASLGPTPTGVPTESPVLTLPPTPTAFVVLPTVTAVPTIELDPEFAPLLQTYGTSLDIPIWLPQRAPKAEAGVRCSHYGLITTTNSPQIAPGDYDITMVCWGPPVLPNVPELLRPGAWAMNLYLGEMFGTKSGAPTPDKVSDFFQQSPTLTITDFRLATGVVAQLYEQSGVSVVAWREGGWQYIAQNEVTNAPVREMADQLADLATTDSLIPTVGTGTVRLVRGGAQLYTVIDWKVSTVSYEINWRKTPESAIAMARTLVPISTRP